jgi:HEAT repeat protein
MTAGARPPASSTDPILQAASRAFGHPVPAVAGGSIPPRPPVTGGAASGRASGLLARAAGEPDALARRGLFDQAVEQGLSLADMEAVGRLLVGDPDPSIRRAAARALLPAGRRVTLRFLARALEDPDDMVRADVVAVAAARGAAAPLLIPLSTSRAFPHTAGAARHALREAVEAGGVSAGHRESLVSSVGAMDPPPMTRERPGLEAVARALGIDVLAASLGAGSADAVRLGAARLLHLEGSPPSLAALATAVDDPSEEVRALAWQAVRATAPAGSSTFPVSSSAPPRPSGGSVGEDDPAAGDAGLFSALGRALTDPDPAVREAAGRAIESLPRQAVERWTAAAMEAGRADAVAAAAMMGRFGLTSAASAALDVACGLPSEARAPFVSALASLEMSPEELVGMVALASPAHVPTAVRVAWEVGGRSVLPTLAMLLGNSSGPVRMAVLSVLSEAGTSWHADLARDRLANDSSAAVRATAVHTLGTAEPDARLDALRRALADPDPDVRATAVETLPEGIESEASSLLVPALEDEDERVWRASLRHLAALPEEDLPVLWAALRESPPRKREALLRAVEGIDVHRLARLAADHARAEAAGDRVMAVDLAARAGTAEATPLVLTALEDPDPTVRRRAASALSTLRVASAVAALARTLADPQAEVRVEGVRALALIDDDVVPDILLTALKDPEVRVREMATEALTRWQSPAVARRLAAALSSPDLRRPAGEVLERMGRVVIDPLTEVAVGPDPDAAAAAGTLLERIAGAQAFVAQLASIDPAARLRGVQVLGAIGGPVAAEALTSALTDPDVAVRSRAAMLIGGLHYLPAVKPLRRMFLTDPVIDAVAAAEAALRLLGTVPPAAEDLRLVPDETDGHSDDSPD